VTPENRTGKVSILRADSRDRHGAIPALRHLSNEVWRFRGQIWTVYKQNFRNLYQGSGLGVFWNFILPLVPLTVYLFLSKIRVFPNFEGVDGATYITFGVTVWFVLTGFINLPISIVQSRNQAAMRTSLPLSASIASGFAGLLFETLVRLVFITALIIATRNWPALTAPGVILLIGPAFFLFFGTGLILGVLNVIYKDVARITKILLQYGLFVSGVIFPLGASKWSVLTGIYNPLAVFVHAFRQIVFQGRIDSLIPLAVWSAMGLVIFALGCRLFYVMEYRIRGIN